MPRVASLVVLLGIVLLIGTLFFQVMAQFLVPLFLAAVMVVIFKPLHRWIVQRCGGHNRVAAILTTLSIVLIVFLPLVGLLVRAVAEGAELYQNFREDNVALLAEELEHFDGVEPPVEVDEVGELEEVEPESSLNTFIERLVNELNEFLDKFQVPALDPREVQALLVGHLNAAAAPLALGGVRVLAGSLFGMAIMVLTMYYFFADGPSMISALMRLSPLDDDYERELLNKFSDISRAVVVATLLAAIVQGILAGVGFALVGVQKVFFLTGLTIFLAMIPFVGAAAVWVPVCAWLYFHDGRTTAALILTIYCVAIVSTVDNIIKPLVLHGQSNLHPLLALLSVIGGVQVLGPIGILVGPMLVAFFQALLNMLNKELQLLGKAEARETQSRKEESDAGEPSNKIEAKPKPAPKPPHKRRKK